MSENVGFQLYEIRPRNDKRGVDLISDVLPFGRLWYSKVGDAIGYAGHRSRSHHAVIRVYDDAGDVIETHEHKGDFKEPKRCRQSRAHASILLCTKTKER